MRNFSDLGVTITRTFTGDRIRINKVENLDIVVKDYKIQQSKIQNDKDNGRCLYLHIELNGEDRVLWGNYKFLIEQISQIKKEDMPFKARIVNEHGYMFK